MAHWPRLTAVTRATAIVRVLLDEGLVKRDVVLRRYGLGLGLGLGMGMLWLARSVKRTVAGAEVLSASARLKLLAPPRG